jgi:hypothetical protein
MVLAVHLVDLEHYRLLSLHCLPSREGVKVSGLGELVEAMTELGLPLVRQSHIQGKLVLLDN